MLIINNLGTYLQAQISLWAGKIVENAELAPEPLQPGQKRETRPVRRVSDFLEPTTGIEPVTCRLRIDCSTI
jgi:hypothetical protein